MTPNAKGALLALLAFAVYATHDVVVKLMGGIYSPIQLIFYSVLFSFPLALLMLMRDRTPGTLLPVHPWWIALRTAAAVLTGLSAFYAFSVLPLAEVYAIIFATPLIITLLAIPVLGEKVGIRRGLAICVGLAGVIVVLQPGETSLTLGHLGALGAAVGGSVASIIVRKIGSEERSVVLLLYPMTANFVLMACALPFVYEPPPIEHLGAFGAMALMGSAGGLIIIFAYKAGEAVVVAPMQYSQILWAALYGALFFDEYPSAATIVGASIIIASGLYIVLREGQSNVSVNRPVLRSRARPETGTTPRRPVLQGFGASVAVSHSEPE
ncbi:DMT family transporter [Flavimaricola marinus]|uniref:EamA-like transporter family protein n=1 Tax=Flavimaricola marinus TaxID=1819565 RepID=A0A238LEG1_9RHOB|nr:DMT family transporter [Flavimaricola marinus]SMY08097.1 EamA-like transporter family protein [Flavimaricola marinus]